MRFPKEVYEIVAKAVEKFKSDNDESIALATQEAEKKIRALPNFNQMIAELITSSIRELVFDERHNKNVDMKRKAGVYGPPGKVNVVSSKSVREAAGISYQYFVAGMTLGLILGSQLPACADQERRHGEGHFKNYRFLSMLIPLVANDKRVMDCVSKKRIVMLWRQADIPGKGAA
jgi:hypothetical protein